MPNNKNQHFVPQFFLKNFSKDKKSISMCLKDSGKVIDIVSIRNQCSKSYFYLDQEYERNLSKFEGECRLSIEKILSSNYQDLKWKDVILLRSFLLLQRSRTQHESSVFREGLKQVRQYLQTFPMTDNIKATSDAYDNLEKNVVGVLTHNLKTALDITADLKCKVLVYNGYGAFLTSDDPVVQSNPLLESYHILNYGLAAIGLLLMLPLSPKYLFVIYDSTCYRIGNRKSLIVNFSNPDDLLWVNLLTVLHADKALYYFPGSLAANDIESLVKRAKATGLRDDMKMTSFVTEDGRSELIYSYRNNYSIGAKFSFLKILDKVREVKFGQTIGVADYSRPYCLQRYMSYDSHSQKMPPMTYLRKR